MSRWISPVLITKKIGVTYSQLTLTLTSKLTPKGWSIFSLYIILNTTINQVKERLIKTILIKQHSN